MNLLRTKWGRFAAFAGLYLSEGLPQGFAGVALVLEFKRRGMDAAAIGAFAGTILLPWSWKFLAGPLVDNFRLARFGARKQWIVFAQIGMLLTLGLALLQLTQVGGGEMVGLGLLTTLLVIHNAFAATQDVAIDALACNVLRQDERGFANGIMFGSAQAGQAIGGSGVLLLKEATGSFMLSSLIVPGILVAVLSCVITMICEKSAAREVADGDLPAPEPGENGFAAVREQVRDYLITAGKTVFGTLNGILGFVIAILPTGGLALSMVISTLIAPTLGMSDGDIARLNLAATAIWIPCCLSGGWLSDRFGRKLTLGVFAGLSVLPGLWIGWELHKAGWDHPPAGVDGVWPREAELIRLWWIAAMIFSFFNGLMYGIKTAFFMDIVNPKIAGTHFTAMMAMTNLVFTYTLIWQGNALSRVTWDWTLWQIFLADTVLGLLFLLVIPFVKMQQIHVKVD